VANVNTIETFKILAQVDTTASGANTLIDAYTVPAGTSTILSSVIVTNRTTTDQRFRVSLAVAGAADDVKQYLYFDVLIFERDTFIATIGVTLATTDKVRVRADAVGITFNVVGVELT